MMNKEYKEDQKNRIMKTNKNGIIRIRKTQKYRFFVLIFYTNETMVKLLIVKKICQFDTMVQKRIRKMNPKIIP